MACAKDFDTALTVETPTETPDGFGGFETTWANTKGTIWCEYEETGGGEGFDNGRLNTETSVSLMTRYRTDITVEDRLVLDGTYYNIRRVDNVRRQGKYLIIQAESGVPN